MPARESPARRRFLAWVASSIVAPSIVPAARAQAVPLVHVGTLAIDEGAQVFYAQDQRFFSRAGIEADIRAMPTGPGIVAAAASGDIDVGFANLFAFAEAFARGAPVRVIAPGQLFTAGRQSIALVVRADSPIHVAKDLNGKKIGVRAAVSLVGVGARAWIDRHGGDSTTIQLVPVPGELHAQALEQGQVDALSASLTDIPVAKNGSKRIIGYPTEAIAPRFIGSGWYARTSWIEKNRDLTHRYAHAIMQASHWANAHQRLSGPILMKYTHLTPEGLRALGDHRAVYSEVLNSSLIEPLIAVAAQYKVIPMAFPARDAIANL